MPRRDIPRRISRCFREEPELLDLFVQAIKHQFNGRCLLDVWYHDLKPQMKELVGFMAPNGSMRSSEDYDACYDMIYEALGDCPHCIEQHKRGY